MRVVYLQGWIGGGTPPNLSERHVYKAGADLGIVVWWGCSRVAQMYPTFKASIHTELGHLRMHE